MKRALASSAWLALLFVLLTGCDETGPPGEDRQAFKTLRSVEFVFDPAFDASVQQTIRFRRAGSRDTLTTRGRVVLESGPYDVRIEARDAEGAVPAYMSTAGPGEGRLLYALDSGLAPHVRLRGSTPPLRPLKDERALVRAKTPPTASFRFTLAADTADAAGQVRLQLRRSRTRPDGTTQRHVDFDVRVPVRVVPPDVNTP